jgi:hypothetical protein
VPYNLCQNAVYESPQNTPLVNVSIPHKTSFIVLLLVVLALLAPYAGCTAGEEESHTQRLEDPRETSRTSKTTKNAPTNEQPLDQIEDILSN